MSAAGGSGLAVYLWKGAVKLSQPEIDRLALGAIPLDDKRAWAESALTLTNHLAAQWEAHYQNKLDALIEAMKVAQEPGIRAGLEHLKTIHPMDFEGFERVSEALKLSFKIQNYSGYAVAFGNALQAKKLSEDTEWLMDQAEQMMFDLTDAARKGETIDRLGVEYRRDMAPELAKVLKIDPTATPRLRDVQKLMQKLASDGTDIPGIRHIKPNAPDAKRPREEMGSLQIVFSADKSISVFHALGTEAEKWAIDKAHRVAVNRALEKISEKAEGIRVKHKGTSTYEPAHMGWVLFHHYATREGDPGLHTHAAIFNVLKSKDTDRVGGLNTYKLNFSYDSFRREYHQKLADGLQEAGFTAKYDTQKLAAVIEHESLTPEILRHFSGSKVRAEDEAREYLAKKGMDFDALTPAERSYHMTNAADAVRRKADKVPEYNPEIWNKRATDQGYVPIPHFIDPKWQIAHKEYAIWVDQQVAKAMVDAKSPTQQANEAANQRVEQGARKVVQNIAWMYGQGGIDALSPKQLARAKVSYTEWAKENPAAARHHGLADYVQYVQERFADEGRAPGMKGVSSSYKQGIRNLEKVLGNIQPDQRYNIGGEYMDWEHKPGIKL